jgi:hypothetical protein
MMTYMYDRDEFLRARVGNYLKSQRAPMKLVSTEFGILAVRQASHNGISVGDFGISKKDYKKNERNFFIETPPDEQGIARQLWLPALQWVFLGTIRQREIIATESAPSDRFDAWQQVQPLIKDLENYSEYDSDGQALYNEAKLTLEHIGANNEGFRTSITKINL